MDAINNQLTFELEGYISGVVKQTEMELTVFFTDYQYGEFVVVIPKNIPVFYEGNALKNQKYYFAVSIQGTRLIKRLNKSFTDKIIRNDLVVLKAKKLNSLKGSENMKNRI